MTVTFSARFMLLAHIKHQLHFELGTLSTIVGSLKRSEFSVKLHLL